MVPMNINVHLKRENNFSMIKTRSDTGVLIDSIIQSSMHCDQFVYSVIHLFTTSEATSTHSESPKRSLGPMTGTKSIQSFICSFKHLFMSHPPFTHPPF